MSAVATAASSTVSSIGARAASASAAIVIQTAVMRAAARGVRGLAARDVTLEHERREPVRGGVHRSGKPGRARSDDRQIVVPARGWRAHPPGLDEPLDRRGLDALVPVDDDGKLRVGQVVRAQRRLRLRRAGLDPVEGLRDAGQQVAQAMVLGLQPAADDDGGPDRARCANSSQATVPASRAGLLAGRGTYWRAWAGESASRPDSASRPSRSASAAPKPTRSPATGSASPPGCTPATAEPADLTPAGSRDQQPPSPGD